jgi:hypothetical protein
MFRNVRKAARPSEDRSTVPSYDDCRARGIRRVRRSEHRFRTLLKADWVLEARVRRSLLGRSGQSPTAEH